MGNKKRGRTPNGGVSGLRHPRAPPRADFLNLQSKNLRCPCLPPPASLAVSKVLSLAPLQMPGPRRLAPFRGRVAYPSYVDESLFGNPHEGAVRMARSMPDASAFPTVLGAAEYGTMEVRARATGRELNEKQQDKARLHALSNARKSKWPNTLEANRERKERGRQDKLDVEEALRKEIDAEEESLMVEKRRLAIERANKMLYDSTDRVKSLHSKLLLADVMQARPHPSPSPLALALSPAHPHTLISPSLTLSLAPPTARTPSPCEERERQLTCHPPTTHTALTSPLTSRLTSRLTFPLPPARSASGSWS